MDPDLILDDLPAEARTMINETEAELIEVRAAAEQQTDEIRVRADRAIAEVNARTAEEVRRRQRRLLERLRPLQDSYAKKGKLDEALAIRERIRSLKGELLHAAEDPGTLSGLPQQPAGTQLLFN